MPLKVLPCTDEDYSHAALVEKDAFADDEFAPVLFPGPFSGDALKHRTGEIVANLQKDPTAVWMKVVDTNNEAAPEQGVSFAKWNLYKDAPPGPRETLMVGPGCNKEACDAVFGGLREQRARVLGDTKCVYLHVLVTDPAYQRRGAGSLHLRWGAEKAQELGLPMYVEASDKGYGLYKKFGFELLETQETDMVQFGGKGTHRVYALMAEKPRVPALSQTVAQT